MCLMPVKLAKYQFFVPCGKCIECRISHSIEWAYRVVAETRAHEHNCMVTLTYADEHLPRDMSVSVYEMQTFLKRLRKAIQPSEIRFFGCGEYGEQFLRPHYHMIVFGYDFSDRYLFGYDKKKTKLYRSPRLEKVWPKGFSSVCEVEFDVAKYVAIYLQKPPADGRHRAFVNMSRNPGIGYQAIKPNLMETDKLYQDGKYIHLPRYYLKVLERSYPDQIADLKERRINHAISEYVEMMTDIEHYTTQIEYRKHRFEKIFGKPLDKNCMV